MVVGGVGDEMIREPARGARDEIDGPVHSTGGEQGNRCDGANEMHGSHPVILPIRPLKGQRIRRTRWGFPQVAANSGSNAATGSSPCTFS